MSATTPKCKPFSINLAVLAPDNKRQVSFGITKGCNDDDTPFYMINLVLRDRTEDGFQDRVKLDVRVGDTNSPKAQALLEQGLTMSQIEFLQGPITARAKALPAGTTSDQKLGQLTEKILDVK